MGVQQHLGLGPRGVDMRHLHQRGGRRLHDEVVDRHLVGLGAVLRRFRVDRLARRQQRVELDIGGQIVMRNVALGGGQPLRHRLAHGIVRHGGIAALGIEQARIGQRPRQRQGGRSGCRLRGLARGRGRRGLRGGLHGPPCQRLFDIRLHDAPAGAGAGDERQVHLALARDPPGQRRGEHALPRGGDRRGDSGRCRCSFHLDLGLPCLSSPARGGRGAKRRRGRGGRGGARILALARQHGDGRVDLHALRAFRHQDLRQRALIDGFDFHRRLVGLDLGDHVARLDRVAFLLQPLGERALLHRRRQRGHQDVGRHGC